MGEIAEGMIDGEDCVLCGAAFAVPNGFPAACADCWNDLPRNERKHYQRSRSRLAGDDRAEAEAAR